MHEFQYWLMNTLGNIDIVEDFMSSRFGWPVVESLHFMGLSMLMGMVGAFDLRLLGVAKGIPFATLHRLIPIGIAGYCLNVCTGFMFLVSAPDQYIFNSAFHWKMFLMMLAGLNVLTFYSAVFGKVKTLEAGADAPLSARIIGGASLTFWTGIIIFGRLITFYRPFVCQEGEVLGLLATCVQ